MNPILLLVHYFDVKVGEFQALQTFFGDSYKMGLIEEMALYDEAARALNCESNG